MRRVVEFDLVTKSEANERFASRGGMFGKANRIKKTRAAVVEACRKLGAAPGLYFVPSGAAQSFTVPNRIEVRLVRIGPGTLDAHDNLRIALKAPVDAVCEDWIGVRDDHPQIKVMPAGQERTPGVSSQGPCPVCLARAGEGCAPVTGAKVSKGLHAARRTPWRVRVEVRDLTPGPDRVLVLASVEAQKRKKAKPRKAVKEGPGGDEDRTARLLVACPTCRALSGEHCQAKRAPWTRMLHGVHASRAAAAGHEGVKLEAVAPPRASGPRRVVASGSSSIARVALPWAQSVCSLCDGRRRMFEASANAETGEACPRCNGSGIDPIARSRPFVEKRPGVPTSAPCVKLPVPAAHRARWGAEVTLWPRVVRAKGGGSWTLFEWKEGSRS